MWFLTEYSLFGGENRAACEIRYIYVLRAQETDPCLSFLQLVQTSVIELIGPILLIGVKHSPMLIPFYQVPKAVFTPTVHGGWRIMVN